MTRNRSTAPKKTNSRAASQPTQLRLLDGGRTSLRVWQLDARTRTIGRQRVAEAREILRRAQPHDQIAG